MPLPLDIEWVHVAVSKGDGPYLAIVSYRRSNEVLDLVLLPHGMTGTECTAHNIVAEEIEPEGFDAIGMPLNFGPGENAAARWWPV
jgi:hypothetical protein